MLETQIWYQSVRNYVCFYAVAHQFELALIVFEISQFEHNHLTKTVVKSGADLGSISYNSSVIVSIFMKFEIKVPGGNVLDIPNSRCYAFSHSLLP